MLLEVGRIDKPHGVRGECLVTLTTDRSERVAVDSVLITDDGPLTVVSSRPHQHRWLVRFAEVGDRTAAEERRGTVLRGEPLDDPDTLWVHDLIGATCHEVGGAELGEVVAVEQNPASDLLVLDNDLLIPLTFLVSNEPGRLLFDLPVGLVDPGQAETIQPG